MNNEENRGTAQYIINLLILYQGTTSEGLADQLIKPMKEDWGGDIKCEPRQVGFGENVSDETVQNRFMQELAWANVAVAILAIDERPASTTGSIWLEIGWWFAKKPRGTILLCCQKHNQVQVPSNILGNVVPSFSNLTDLVQMTKDLVVRKVGDVRFRRVGRDTAYDQEGRYVDYLKLCDTLGSNVWLPDSAHTCEYLVLRPQAGPGNDTETAECDFRQESASFISELLRMGKCNHENAEIQHCFYQVGRYAKEAVATEDEEFYPTNEQRDESERTMKRQECLEKLSVWLGMLYDLGDELLMPRASRYSKPAKDTWEKLEYFMKYRLNLAVQYHRQVPGFREVYIKASAMIKYVTPFTDWARKLRDGSYTENAYFKQRKRESNEATDEANIIKEYSWLSDTMAIVLACIGDEYFTQCRNSMKQMLNNDTNPFDDMKQTFQILRLQLPHNKPNFYLPDIWPGKKEGARA